MNFIILKKISYTLFIFELISQIILLFFFNIPLFEKNEKNLSTDFKLNFHNIKKLINIDNEHFFLGWVNENHNFYINDNLNKKIVLTNTNYFGNKDHIGKKYIIYNQPGYSVHQIQSLLERDIDYLKGRELNILLNHHAFKSLKSSNWYVRREIFRTLYYNNFWLLKLSFSKYFLFHKGIIKNQNKDRKLENKKNKVKFIEDNTLKDIWYFKKSEGSIFQKDLDKSYLVLEKINNYSKSHDISLQFLFIPNKLQTNSNGSNIFYKELITFCKNKNISCSDLTDLFKNNKNRLVWNSSTIFADLGQNIVLSSLK